MRYWNVVLIVTIVFANLSVASPSFASSADLEKRLAELEEQVAVLRRQIELKKEDEDKIKTEAPIITASSKEGFSIKSPDESFKLRIRGLIQADGRFFTDNQKDNSTTDTFSVRRARPIFEGTVGKDFDFYLMPEFGSGSASLVDAYGEFKLSKQAKIRGGKFKAPFGLERLQSDSVANFTEIGLPSNLAPNREVGFQLSGDVLGDTTNYALGVFNGSADLASTTSQDTDNNNDKDLVGRIFVHPFKNNGPETLKGFGVGIAGSYGHKEGSTLPTYRSTGQSGIFSYASGVSADGAHVRFSPQAYFYKGSLGLLGEYTQSQQKVARSSGGIIRDSFTNKAWQISGNYVLTGEVASYKGITPRTNFDWSKGTWGAFDVVGRYGHLDIDDSIFTGGFASLNTAVSEADAWGLGLNWYPNRNVRLSLDYEQTQFERGNTSGLDRKTENAILSRFQVSY